MKCLVRTQWSVLFALATATGSSRRLSCRLSRPSTSSMPLHRPMPTNNQPPSQLAPPLDTLGTPCIPYHCSAAFVPLSVLQRSPQSAHHSCPRQDVIFAQGRNGPRPILYFLPPNSVRPLAWMVTRTHIRG